MGLIAQNPGDMNQPFRLNYANSKTQGVALGFYESAPSVRKTLQTGWVHESGLAYDWRWSFSVYGLSEMSKP